MKKIKYTQLIIGFICGAVAMSATGAYASVGDKLEAVVTHFNFVVNGETKQLDAQIIAIDGSSYLPVRAMSDLLGYNVDYKDETRTIELNSKNIRQPNTSPESVESTKKIFYLGKDVIEKYRPTSSRLLDSGHVLWTINGKEFDSEEILTDNDIYHIDGTNLIYYSKDYYLHFLTEDQLKEFQSYSINFDTGIITPIS